MPITSGTQLGHYQVIAQLGAGGMGEVYRARDSRLDRDVAVKVLAERLASDPSVMERFQREAKALAALSHPNILTIHDIGTETGISFIVMELLQGESLRSHIDRSRLPWKRAVEIAVVMAEGLSAAHSQGIIHRDLKPDNVFLTSNGTIKILDFGLAQFRKYSEKGMTEPGTTLGTVGYMSPEQVRGGPVDARGDIFSFGCLLHEMVTGTAPFSRETIPEILTAILREEPPEVIPSETEIPLELGHVIRHCLEKNSEARFQTAQDLIFALKSLLRTSGSLQTIPIIPSTRMRSIPWKWTLRLAALIGCLTLLYHFTKPGKEMHSLAILPFANAREDPEMEYLCDGIADTLINRLSQLSELRVMARGTVFTYKGRQVDPRVVGRELNVDAVVTGSLVQQGDTLLIQVDMVDVTDGHQLWGEQYRRTISDLPALQSEISKEILDRLRWKLTHEEQKTLATPDTNTTQAYQAYLKGRFYWNKRSKEGFEKGLKYFHQAIDQDPNYAKAYAGMADCYTLLYVYGILPPTGVIGKARAAASKAIEIDKTLAEPHATLGLIADSYDWDFLQAELEFKRAVELNPGYPTAHHWYGETLVQVGRINEAIAEIKRALDLDPLSPIINITLGDYLYLAGEYDQAIEQYKKTLELTPDFAPAYDHIGTTYCMQKKYEQAILSSQKAVDISGGDVQYKSKLGFICAMSGKRDQAEKLLHELNETSKSRYVAPGNFAILYMGLGNRDQTFFWLEKTYEERSYLMLLLKVEPMFDMIRDDPRYGSLLRRVGLTSAK